MNYNFLDEIVCQSALITKNSAFQEPSKYLDFSKHVRTHKFNEGTMDFVDKIGQGLPQGTRAVKGKHFRVDIM